MPSLFQVNFQWLVEMQLAGVFVVPTRYTEPVVGT
jgi:hypothetical protein